MVLQNRWIEHRNVTIPTAYQNLNYTPISFQFTPPPAANRLRRNEVQNVIETYHRLPLDFHDSIAGAHSLQNKILHKAIQPTAIFNEELVPFFFNREHPTSTT